MLYEDITDKILGCAVAVHRALGPGLPERPYKVAMAIEMRDRGLRFDVDPPLEMTYKGIPVGQHRPDFIVEDKVVVELKSAARFEAVFTAQVLTYLRASGKRVGLLLNFNVHSMPYGIKRFVNGA